MFKYLKFFLCYILPKRLVTVFLGYIANLKCGKLTKIIIDIYIWFYDINMTEVKERNTSNYKTFNDFFARSLKNEARVIIDNPNSIIIPADGIISQIGQIKGDKIFQAKSHFYSVRELLADNDDLASKFIDGNFINIYLTPRDYHRVHMPCDGILREMIYVPGSLYSVNHFSAMNIKNIFARNERVICIFDTYLGPMVQILVGAIIVGSIETTWAGPVISGRKGIIKRWQYPIVNNHNTIRLRKGQEMGKFKLGSTVINLFPSNSIKIPTHLKPNIKIKYGQLFATSMKNMIK